MRHKDEIVAAKTVGGVDDSRFPEGKNTAAGKRGGRQKPIRPLTMFKSGITTPSEFNQRMNENEWIARRRALAHSCPLVDALTHTHTQHTHG